MPRLVGAVWASRAGPGRAVGAARIADEIRLVRDAAGAAEIGGDDDERRSVELPRPGAVAVEAANQLAFRVMRDVAQQRGEISRHFSGDRFVTAGAGQGCVSHGRTLRGGDA